MSRVLITGGGGFLGSYVINELKKSDHDIVVMDKFPFKQKGVDFIKQDLRRPFKLSKNLDYCIHLAAIVGGIQYFHMHPAENVHDNSLILANVFEACANSRIEKIIYASSSVVYQYAKTFPTPEDEVERIPPPSSAYGYTKLLGEFFCRAYLAERGLPYTIFRPFNAYGPGEAPDMDYAHVIPQLVWKVLGGQYPVEVYGSGKQTRCFTHGRDIARAFAIGLSHPNAKNEVFNVSSNEEICIKDLLQKIWRLTRQKKPLLIKNLSPFPEDVVKRRPSTEKIRRKLGWYARIRFDVGLRETVKWLIKWKKSSSCHCERN